MLLFYTRPTIHGILIVSKSQYILYVLRVQWHMDKSVSTLILIHVCSCISSVVCRVPSVISVRRGCVTDDVVSPLTPVPVLWQLLCVWSVRETSGAMVRANSSSSM